MPLSIPQLHTRRRALRRAVDFECDVRSQMWEGAAAHRVREISPLGMWLESDLPLESGEQVLLSFRPPRWSRQEWPLITRGEVVRVGLHRRRADGRPAGMGLCFLGLDEDERMRLAHTLRGLPPPLPPVPAPVEAESPLQALRLPDGRVTMLTAEAPLLTSRAPRSVLWSRELPEPPVARRGRRSRRYVPRHERLAVRAHLRLIA